MNLIAVCAIPDWAGWLNGIEKINETQDLAIVNDLGMPMNDSVLGIAA